MDKIYTNSRTERLRPRTPTSQASAVSHDKLPITAATPAEAVIYSRTAAAAFFEAYDDGTNTGEIETHLTREFSEERQRLELEDPAITVLAGREPDGIWAGFATLRAGSRAGGVSAERPMEILRFYLRATWYGRGLARPLMDAALAHARAAGHDGVWLQVWEHNARARRFYEKSGFAAVGTNPFLFGNTPEDDIVYQILLGSSDGSPG